MQKIGLFLLSLVAVLVLGACNSDGSSIKTYTATLAGASEVPPVTTEATGSVTVELDGNDLTLTGTYSGLSGAAAAAHIHGPAAVGANAGVILELTVTEGSTAGSGTLSGSDTLTDDEVADLQDGLYYVNVHTAANPSGEIRGQLEE